MFKFISRSAQDKGNPNHHAIVRRRYQISIVGLLVFCPISTFGAGSATVAMLQVEKAPQKRITDPGRLAHETPQSSPVLRDGHAPKEVLVAAEYWQLRQRLEVAETVPAMRDWRRSP